MHIAVFVQHVLKVSSISQHGYFERRDHIYKPADGFTAFCPLWWKKRYRNNILQGYYNSLNLIFFHLKRTAMWLCRRDYVWRVHIYWSAVWRHCYSCLWWGVRCICFTVPLSYNYSIHLEPFVLSTFEADFKKNYSYIRHRLVGKATRNCRSQGWDGRVPTCEGALNYHSLIC